MALKKREKLALGLLKARQRLVGRAFLLLCGQGFLPLVAGLGLFCWGFPGSRPGLGVFVDLKI